MLDIGTFILVFVLIIVVCVIIAYRVINVRKLNVSLDSNESQIKKTSEVLDRNVDVLSNAINDLMYVDSKMNETILKNDKDRKASEGDIWDMLNMTQQQLTVEEEQRMTNDSMILQDTSKRIALEESQRIQALQALQDKLVQEEQQRHQEYQNIYGTFAADRKQYDNMYSTLQNLQQIIVNDEQSNTIATNFANAQSQIKTLQKNINTEISNRNASESTINNSVSSFENKLASEAAQRDAQDKTLLDMMNATQQQLLTESAARQKAIADVIQEIANKNKVVISSDSQLAKTLADYEINTDADIKMLKSHIQEIISNGKNNVQVKGVDGGQLLASSASPILSWDNTGVTVPGQLNTNTGIQVTNPDPGVLIEKKYNNDGSDRYGIGQYFPGETRMYTSSKYDKSSVKLGFANSDNTFNDVLTLGREVNEWGDVPKGTIQNVATVSGKLKVQNGNGDHNWIEVDGHHGDSIQMGSDYVNRGIWNWGPRDFTIYNQGNPGLTVSQDGTTKANKALKADSLLVQPSTGGHGQTRQISVSSSSAADGSPSLLNMGVQGNGFQGTAFVDTAKGGVAAQPALSLRTNGQEAVRIDGYNQNVTVNKALNVNEGISTSKGVQVTNDNPGPLIEKKYFNDPGNRYGVAQDLNGTTRVYGATAWGPASVNLSMAKSDGSYTDVLKVDNSSTTTVNGPLKICDKNNKNCFTLSSEPGNGLPDAQQRLKISGPNGGHVASFGSDASQDRFQVYKNADGKQPYYWINNYGGTGWY